MNHSCHIRTHTPLHVSRLIYMYRTVQESRFMRHGCLQHENVKNAVDPGSNQVCQVASWWPVPGEVRGKEEKTRNVRDPFLGYAWKHGDMLWSLSFFLNLQKGKSVSPRLKAIPSCGIIVPTKFPTSHAVHFSAFTQQRSGSLAVMNKILILAPKIRFDHNRIPFDGLELRTKPKRGEPTICKRLHNLVF